MCALGDMVDEREVGFIKLDMEGAALDALHGEERTMIRDGSFLARMVFVHGRLTEYKFWIRHYGHLHYETVLLRIGREIGATA